MAKILISLLSKHTLPNVFVIRASDFSNMEAFIFVSTELMEQHKVFKAIEKASDLENRPTQKVIVKEDDLANIHARLDALNLSKTDEYYLNLTGGTKIMSIGVYNFFTQNGFNSHIFYVPIGKNLIHKIFPLDDVKIKPLTFRIGLADYLASYGVEIHEPKYINNTSKDPEYTRQLFSWFISEKRFTYQGKPFWWFASKLRKWVKPELGLNEIPWLESFIKDIDLPHIFPRKLMESEIQYLIGGWFEEFIYFAFKNTLKLENDFFGNSVHIKRENQKGKLVSNEFDVMFVYKNVLHVIECKTGLGRPKEVKQLFNNTVYKLAALRTEFGLQVKAYFLTLANTRNENGYIKESFQRRAAMHNIVFMDRVSILNDFEAFLQKLSGNTKS